MCNILKTLKNYDFDIPPQNISSGRIVRWGKNNRFWIKRFEGGYVFGDFVSGLSTHAFDKAENEYTKAELKRVRERMKKAQQEAEIEQRNVQEDTSSRAENLWNNASETSDHPYLSKKKILSHGLRDYKGCLVIPLKDVDGKLWSLQFITENSEKRFLNGGKKKGCYFLIGTLAENAFVCEGYATGATVYECTGEPVVVAFDSGNLKSVVQAIHEKYPKLKIAICADNDCYNNVNAGLEKAKEAALIANAPVFVPKFKDVSSKPTDFNDLFILEGKDAVNLLLKDAFKDHKILIFQKVLHFQMMAYFALIVTQISLCAFRITSKLWLLQKTTAKSEDLLNFETTGIIYSALLLNRKCSQRTAIKLEFI